jgi:tRNA splicing endonuclease
MLNRGKLMHRIKDNHIEISDKETVQKLRSMGGGFENEGKIEISFLEAAYFAQNKIIENLNESELIALAGKTDAKAELKFQVLRTLRNRGYAIRPSIENNNYMRLHRKGIRPGEDKTSSIVKVFEKSEKFDLKSIKEDLAFSSQVRKELVYAVVDEKDGDIEFIKISKTEFD